MKYIDIENQVAEDFLFNVNIPINVMREIDSDYLKVPEGRSKRIGIFLISKYGNTISMIGMSYKFVGVYWWNNIKNNLEVTNMNNELCTLEINYIEN